MHKKRKNRYLFHPLEVAISGYSGVGKTTLIRNLIEAFSNDFRVGYAKHDAHKFEMDYQGKDTWYAKEAGASQVSINSQSQHVTINQGEADMFWQEQTLLNSDFVLIEGYKKQKFAPAVYLLNEQNEHPMLEEPSENLIAVIGQATENPVASEIPYFHREDIAAIKEFLQLHFDSIVNRRSLKGLILAGGHSTRMGEDKASLSYHGQSQLAHGAFLLSEYCSEVFVSCRANQKLPEDAAHLPVLEDKLLGMGPMSGIFSAFQEQNDAAWLVIACDLPLLNEAFLKQLLEGRNPYRFATSFKSTSCPFPEPLCSIYEPKIYTRLCQAIGLGIECPRKVLINSPISLLLQGNENILDNANTQEDRDRMRKQIQGNEL